tara:strand:- start:1754 stop:2299 length:546 start_codon:yes stop_codon:yes gene_type:complete
MAKEIAIVGNGPSRHLYTEPFDSDVCVCNVPHDINIKYDYITIVDRMAMNYIHKNKLKFDAPILTTNDQWQFAHTNGFKTEVRDVYKTKLMNTAATAAYYFSDMYDTIYLYGCDALFSEVTTSYQDEIIQRGKRSNTLHTQWRDKWATVWNTDCNFVICCPEDTETIDYRKNVKWYHSKNS